MTTYNIAYGTDTGSIEDPTQLVLVHCPDDWSDLDTDDLSERLDAEWASLDTEPLVGMRSMVETLNSVIALTPGVSRADLDTVIAFVSTALDSAVGTR